MKKRTFLKLSSTLVAGTVISPMTSWEQDEKLKNWAGNIEYSTGKLYSPASLEQVRELVKKYSHLKVLGTRHCFNRIADSTDHFISLKQLDQMELDPLAHTVTVGSGVTYGQLGPWLDSKGFALHNLASLPHISVAGAITTGTHGSGVKNGSLSTAVSALEFVTADGEVQVLSRAKDGEKFTAAVIGLGGIGVLTKVTLDIQPSYKMQQDVYEKLPLDQIKDHFDEIVAAGYSVSLFTDWANDYFNEVWIKNRLKQGQALELRPWFHGATRATKNLHPIAALSAENCTEQMGVPGPWYERLPHFRMGFTPSSGKELQSEYFVPHYNAVEAILAIARMGKQISPHLLISEIRTIAADDYWMSPCYQQSAVTIHFTWQPDWPAVSKLLPVIEKELAPFNARPHWGKLFTMPPSRLKELYKKLPDFQQLLTHYDPKGKFRNKFLEENIFGS
ncbi:MAG TPA: D-arabinono-1,4-lactone oxidase [Puia sp.]